MRLAIIVPEARAEIVSIMEKRALEVANSRGLEVPSVTRVPGLLEAPLVAKILLSKSVDAAVILGAIVADFSAHHLVIGQALASAIIQISLETGKPVTLGFVGPGSTLENALREAPFFAERAVAAAHKMYVILKATD